MLFPAEARARLAKILADNLADREVQARDKTWIKIARERREEIRSGYVKAVPREEALKKVRSILD
jgi:hypothetical protein